MVYLLNTQLKDNKNCINALSRCYGLGNLLSQQVCDRLGISRFIKCSKLNASNQSKLVECISQNYQINKLLRADINQNKARLVSISCYRGFRLNRGLPCRGQRTHGNSRTCRKLNKI